MKTFRLISEPSSYQLGYHFSNLVTYFHPINNESTFKSDIDKNITATTGQVIRIFEFLLFEYNLELIEIFITKRKEFPIHFRCSQIINHYGAVQVRQWIKLIYGKDV